MAQLQFDTTLRISVDIVEVKAASAIDQQEEMGDQEEEEGDDSDNQGSRRGFAAMDPEKRREIARKGGESSRGGGRGRGSSGDGDQQLEAMESLLRSRQDLPEEGKREIQQAIDKKRDELGHAQH